MTLVNIKNWRTILKAFIGFLFIAILSNLNASEVAPREAKSQILYVHTSKNVSQIQNVLRIYNTLDDVIMADRCTMNAKTKQISCSKMKEWRNLCLDQLEKYTDQDAIKELIRKEMKNEKSSAGDKVKFILGFLGIILVFGVLVSLTTMTYLITIAGSMVLVVKMMFFTPSDIELKTQTEDVVRYLERYSAETTVINSQYFDIGTENFILIANEKLSQEKSNNELCRD